jgi:hypothetical protein
MKNSLNSVSTCLKVVDTRRFRLIFKVAVVMIYGLLVNVVCADREARVEGSYSTLNPVLPLCLPRIVSVALSAHPCGTLIADLIDELATLLAVALGGLAVYGAETSTSKCRESILLKNPVLHQQELGGEIEKRNFRSGRQTSMQPACSA